MFVWGNELDVDVLRLDIFFDGGGSANNDGVEFIDIRNKYVLHTFEQLNQEGTSDVCVHCACDGIGKCGKTKYILHGT